MMPVKAIDGKKMRGNFSAHAGDYDLYSAVQKRVVKHLCARISASGTGSGLILDVGSGTGALAAAVGQLCPDPMVVMDIAHGMTQAAHQRLPTVHACDGDARFLPFADGAFSTIVSSSVYQWVDCLPTAFAEVARALQPGGTFALALFGEQTLCELRRCHRRAVAESSQSRASHVQSFPSCDEVASALATASLVTDDVSACMEVEYHVDVPDLLRQLKQIGAGNASVNRPRGLASRRVMQRMIALYEEDYRCDQGIPASYEVLIALARKV